MPFLNTLGTTFSPFQPFRVGGDERSRTAGLPLAKRTLYQLSYIPFNYLKLAGILSTRPRTNYYMVGLSRLERLTSPLSAECSNQLSYRPVFLFEYIPTL